MAVAAASRSLEPSLSEWPEWTGDCVAIIASGPSTKGVDVEWLKGRTRVLAVKQNIDLCPWADAVYGCDGAWWRHRRGLPEFSGLKIAWDETVCNEYGLKRALIPNKLSNELLFGDVGTIGAGGNSGFQALNLAVQFGAKRILLVGFDMHDRSGVHWYGRNTWMGANNPDAHNFQRWMTAFNNAAKTLSIMNVDVVNASPISAMRCFRHRTVEQALYEWDLA